MKRNKVEKPGNAGNLFQELAKVQWPSFGELMSTSFLVIMFTVLFGLYFFVCELIATAFITRIVG